QFIKHNQSKADLATFLSNHFLKRTKSLHP
ncbi:hypothetical protein LSAT2_004803, partial [Lamellibrachia satsuma]